jgi:hypothetical protein
MSIEQLLATQNELKRVLTENLMQREVRMPHRQPRVDSSYTDFLVMHPLTFTEPIDPLEADNWLRITESKFGFSTVLSSRRLCSWPSSFMDP